MTTVTVTVGTDVATADLGISEAQVRAEVGTGLAPDDDPTTWPVINGDVILTVPGAVLQRRVIHGRVIVRARDCSVLHCVVDGGAIPSGNTALIDGNSAAAANLTVSYVRLVPANPSVWVDALIGWDIHADHVYVRGTVDGIGFYSTTGGKVGTTVTWAVFELLAYISPDPNHSDKHTHNDPCQGQGGDGGTFTNVVLCATADPAIGTPSPYAPNATGQAFTVSPNTAQVSGLTLTDVHLHGGAAGFIAILGSKGAPTKPLGTFTRVTIYRDQHPIGGVMRQVVIDPGYTWAGGFQNPDGTPIIPIRAAA